MPAIIETLLEALGLALKANDAARAAYVSRILTERLEILAAARAARPR
jgi:hypothetical protein